MGSGRCETAAQAGELTTLTASTRHSQYGQDVLIGDVLFRGRTGVFVDVGARCGVVISNTYHLEALGWDGLAIEPHPELYLSLSNNRRCRSVNVAASDVAGSLEFVRFLEEPLGNSGLLSSFRDPDRLSAVRHEIIQVPSRPLSELLITCPLVHYLDIDVEGHELQVLHGLDFNRIEIRVIGVEVAEGQAASTMDEFLARQGFRPFAQLFSDRFYSFGDEPPSAERFSRLP